MQPARTPSPDPQPLAPFIGILSDDLTGSNGVAAVFAARGLRARTVLGPCGDSALYRSAEVTVVDTATRDASPDAAYQVVRAAAVGLRDAGAGFIAKRIDTTLRGNVGRETAAVLDALGPRTVAVVVPAAPEAGRVAVGGRVLLNGRPVSELTGGRDDPSALIAEQAACRAAAIGLATVRRGAAAVAAALGDAARDNLFVIVFDAETVEDVHTVAWGVAESGSEVVAVDPGGFTLALATARGLVAEASAGTGAGRPGVRASLTSPATRTPAVAAHRMKRVLAIFGSPAGIAAEQVRLAARLGLVSLTELDGQGVTQGSAHAEQEIARVTAALLADPAPAVGVRVRHSRRDEGMMTAGAGAPQHVAPDPLAAALAAVAQRVLAGDRRVGGLYLSGGKVARVTLDRLRAEAVDVDAEVLPLAAAGRVAGGPYAGLRIVTKGGMIGGPDAVAACLRCLWAELE